MRKLRIFISYAHADNEIKELFVKHLDYRVKAREWESWDDTLMNAGDVWDVVIKGELKKADAIILLVTADFFASKYISEVELLTASEKFAAKAGLVIPVKVAPCSIDEYLDISKLQWINIYDDKIFEKTLEKAQQAANEKGVAEKKAAAIDFAVGKVIKSLEAYANKEEEPTAQDVSLETLRQLDPDALLIVVREGKKINILPPGGADAGQSFHISEQWLPPRAFAIIQRLVAEEELEENEYEALGEAFFYRLFPQKQAQEAFKELFQKHSANRKEDNPLKIILHFDLASAELASLPWEYLWLPFPENEQPGFFVGSKAELVLTRRLSVAGEKGVPPPPIDKIRILVAYSKPPALAELAAVIEENAQKIEEQCQALPNIEIKRYEIISEAKFKEFIAQNGPFEVVHFIGKSRTEKKDAPDEIALFDPATKKPEWLSPERFVQCFEEKNDKTKKPNLLFFNVVRDNTDFCGNLSKTAQQLIDKVDGIMSIQTNVAPEQSVIFAKELYTALGQGKDLDVAVAAAARQLAKQSLRLYGISAAYSRRTLKIEVGRKDEKKPMEISATDWCPNYYILAGSEGLEKCKQKIKIDENGEPTLKRCPNCGENPLMKCPNCGHIMSEKLKVCYRCNYELEDKAALEVKSDTHKMPDSAAPGRFHTRI